jgi:hypothetical protein
VVSVKSAVDPDRCPEFWRNLDYTNGMDSSNENSYVPGNPPARGTGLGSLPFLQSPWAAPVFLVPFVLMLVLHQMLGLSDALLVADQPGKRPAHGYNLLLGINMNLGGAASLLHLCWRSQRVFPWIIAKLLILTILFLLGFLTL